VPKTLGHRGRTCFYQRCTGHETWTPGRAPPVGAQFARHRAVAARHLSGLTSGLRLPLVPVHSIIRSRYPCLCHPPRASTRAPRVPALRGWRSSHDWCATRSPLQSRGGRPSAREGGPAPSLSRFGPETSATERGQRRAQGGAAVPSGHVVASSTSVFFQLLPCRAAHEEAVCPPVYARCPESE